jgi:D-alanyl-D-alanine carboxypeptidase
MNIEKIKTKLSSLSQKAEAKNHKKPFQVLIHSDRHELHFSYPLGCENQIFHVASIGKLFTTVLTLKLVESGKLSLNDKLVKWLDPALLEGLFESDLHEIDVLDCLSHRSGAEDFFEGKPKTGSPLTQIVFEKPNTLWTPEMLLAFTRENLKPVGKRGEKFAYSDTGFLLICMVLEKIEKKPIRLIFEEELFKPLGLNNTQSMIYLYPQDEAKVPLAIWLGKHEVKDLNILSIDQADGGIVSSPEDLVSFNKALYSGKLISKEHLDLMRKMQGKFRAGLHYGTGMMEVHFEEFFFLMKGFPRLTGHIGVLSTHCFYDQINDIHYILNFGSTENMSGSFVYLSNAVGLIKQELK